MDELQWLEAAKLPVTIIGLPFAIGVYVYDRRHEDFRTAPPALLEGEAPGFGATIKRIASEAGATRS